LKKAGGSKICSVKAVENVERGANVYVSTLTRPANGLGVFIEFLSLGASKDTTRGRFKRYQPEGFRLGS